MKFLKWGFRQYCSFLFWLIFFELGNVVLVGGESKAKYVLLGGKKLEKSIRIYV